MLILKGTAEKLYENKLGLQQEWNNWICGVYENVTVIIMVVKKIY